MAKIWKQLVIRRTPQSRIPFRTGDKIAGSLPRVKGAIVSCAFNEKEQKWYDKKENAYTGKLLSPAEAHKKRSSSAVRLSSNNNTDHNIQSFDDSSYIVDHQSNRSSCILGRG